MRLIDAHALHTAGYDVFERCAGKKDAREALREIEKLITTAPTVDAVEVVRCWECKCYPKNFDEGTWNWCCGINNYTKPNDFCSYGHRREEAHNAAD